MTRTAHAIPARFAAVLAAGLGLVFIFGGPQRVAGPSYHEIARFGGAYIWGIAFVVIGLAMFIASQRWSRLLKWAYRVAALGFMSFSIAALGAAYELPNAGITGGWTYFCIAVVHVYLGEKA